MTVLSLDVLSRVCSPESTTRARKQARVFRMFGGGVMPGWLWTLVGVLLVIFLLIAIIPHFH